MIDALVTSAQGAMRQAKRVEKVAENIATGGAAEINRLNAQTGAPAEFINKPLLDAKPINFDEELVTMLEASNLYKANLAVTKTAKEMADTLRESLSKDA